MDIDPLTPLPAAKSAADALFEGKIEEAEAKIERLEKEINEIGQPAAGELQRRLDALKVEEKALRRNFEESRNRGDIDPNRMARIESLLRHIEAEEASVEHDADFLHQAAPSSMILAIEASARLVDLYRRVMKTLVGDHHPAGSSVFVNHTHKNLTDDYGLKDRPSEFPPGRKPDQGVDVN